VTIRFVTAVIGLVSATLRPARRPLVFSARARLRALWDHVRGCYGPPPPGL
jgi:N-acetylglucosaminyl-diphospho-decaprenol L-rhamnosyltransferase